MEKWSFSWITRMNNVTFLKIKVVDMGVSKKNFKNLYELLLTEKVIKEFYSQRVI